MTTKWSEQFPTDNPELPQLRTVIKNSIKENNLSEEQINTLHENISKLIIETVPELVYIDHSDSLLWETGFEDCSKRILINLKQIGIK
jgi:hypothetical protein